MHLWTLRSDLLVDINMKHIASQRYNPSIQTHGARGPYTPGGRDTLQNLWEPVAPDTRAERARVRVKPMVAQSLL